MVKTYNAKIIFEKPEDKVLLSQSLSLANEAFNLVSSERFKMKRCNGSKPLHERTYYKVKESFPNIPSQYIIKVIKDVIAKYETIRKNHQQIEQAPQKRNLQLQLDKRLFTWKDEKELSITTIDGRIRISVETYPLMEEAFRIGSPCDVSIFGRDGEFYLSIPFDFEAPQQDNKETVLGIDLGESRITATNNGELVKGRSFKKEKRKIRHLKKILKSQKTNSSRRKLKQLTRKERNHSRNYIHCLTKHVLSTNTENVIVLEDLTGIKKKNNGKYRNRKSRQIPFFLFRTILTYKAPFYKKRVETVKPHYTSQMDSRGLENGKRKGCRYFGVDGKILDADINAANNIRNRYLQLPSSRCKNLMEGQAIVNEPYAGSISCKPRSL
jgi:putative transposase